MPIPFLLSVLQGGIDVAPYWNILSKILPVIIVVFLAKWYFRGAANSHERLMHSKVVLISGGTSGIGAAVVRDLAFKGAQLVLLTHFPPGDPFLTEYIDDLRSQSGNELIYAEQVDLGSLQSIRRFATKWIDNIPPRRLDLVILCAAVVPSGSESMQITADGLECCWGINYLANFHLLNLLSPALRVQPPDRDVRVVLVDCVPWGAGRRSSIAQSIDGLNRFPASKAALAMFAKTYQDRLNAYERPDRIPNRVRVTLADPGLARTPGMRQWLTRGSLWGLLLYILTWPLWWVVLKSPEQGAQTLLTAIYDPEPSAQITFRFLKECAELSSNNASEPRQAELEQTLWEKSEMQISNAEKRSAPQSLRESRVRAV